MRLNRVLESSLCQLLEAGWMQGRQSGVTGSTDESKRVLQSSPSHLTRRDMMRVIVKRLCFVSHSAGVVA
jgi:hypothetical protein